MPNNELHQQLHFPELVDIKTAAALLAVNIRFMRRQVEERRMPFLKLGRLVRFDLAELRAWVEDQRRPAA